MPILPDPAAFDESCQRARMEAEEVLSFAAGAIDRRFGEGYAEANPTLVAAFMNAVADLTGVHLADGWRRREGKGRGSASEYPP